MYYMHLVLLMRHIGLASAVMGSLQRLWKCSGLSCQTKLHLYQALVMSVLLYSAETWTLTSADLRIGYNFVSITHITVESGCSMEFSAKADQMV